jgi:hypothetical protein
MKNLPISRDEPEQRLRLRTLNMSISCLSTIQLVFFKEDGSLCNTIVDDINMSSKYAYIQFANPSNSDLPNDKRWQVPICNDNICVSREAVQAALEAENIVCPQYETVGSMSLVIGGTQFQPLHHDVPRAFSSWASSRVKFDPEKEGPELGWECG